MAEKAISPSNFSIWPSVSDGEATISYSGASGGIDNDIVVLQYRYSESPGRKNEWGEWSAEINTSQITSDGSFVVLVSEDIKTDRRFQIRVMGTAGEDYASDWVGEDKLILEKMDFTGVTAILGPEMVFSNGESFFPSMQGQVSLTLTNIYNGYFNAIRYVILEYKDSNDRQTTWPEEWVPIGRASFLGSSDSAEFRFVIDEQHIFPSGEHIIDLLRVLNLPSPSQKGVWRKYRVRVQGYAGELYSGPWVEVSHPLIAIDDSLPPIINSPASLDNPSLTTYNPRILIELAEEDDPVPDQRLVYMTGNVVVSSRERLKAFPGGTRIRISRTHEASFYPEREKFIFGSKYGGGVAGESPPVILYVYTETNKTFIDAPLVKNTTPIKAVHSTQLQMGINRAEAYYGLPITVWPRTIIPMATDLYGWMDDVYAMRVAIEGIVDHINNWDSTSTTGTVVLPPWIPLTRRPSAEVMNQLRECLFLF